MSGPDAQRLAADIERQRDQLADTIDALHEKLDVKGHAKHKVAVLRAWATTASGKPRPELVGGVVAVGLVVGVVMWCRSR
jgi:hypothetical protein